jgi:hypothetical protein
MPLESAADFSSYVETTTGHGVTARFNEVQQSLWDSRPGFIDTWYDIDSGSQTNVNIIMDQEYFDIGIGSVNVEGYQPKAIVKSSDVPYISHADLLTVNAITTNNGNTLVPETNFKVINVRPDNLGMVELILEEI